jgi:hypothetical protein
MSGVRRFRHKTGFTDQTDYIEHGPDGNWLVLKSGERKSWKYNLQYSLERVEQGPWVEIPVSETENSKRLMDEIRELAETGKIEVKDKRRVHLENLGGNPDRPAWLPPPKRPKPLPANDVDRFIQENVVADTEIQVVDYVHRPNAVIPEGTARVVLFKDGRVALLTTHVGFFLSPDDIDFIANLSQGQRENVE